MAHGYAPYQESAFRTAVRLLGAAGTGAASVPQGAGPIEGFGYGFGTALKQSNAARMAAEEYAMKRQQTERQTEKDELNRQFLEAEIEKMKRPEKPQKPEKIDPWNMTPEEQERYYKHLEAVERSKSRGKPTKTATGTKPPAAPKVPKPRAAVMKRVDTINGADVNDPAQRDILQRILANPPTPEEAAAAAKKLQVPGTSAYRR